VRSFLRWQLGIITGALFVAIGVYVAVLPLTKRPPLTGSRPLDGAVAFVCLLRGAINVRTSLSRRRAMAARDEAAVE